MLKLLNKEIKLAASPLSFWFLAFSAMVFIPNYPILMGAFFVCFGLFQSFQTTRENNDVLFSVLLPIPKTDAVKAKFLFCFFIEACGFLLTVCFTFLRMTLLKNLTPYSQNTLQNPNLCFLGFVLLVYALFHVCFVGGFFKTGYYFGKPFLFFVLFTMLLIVVFEALPYFPQCGWMRSAGWEECGRQAILFAVCALIYACVTVLSYRKAEKRFEGLDL